jgi:hypothetical protein
MSGAQQSTYSKADQPASSGNRDAYTTSTDPHVSRVPGQLTLPLPLLPDVLEPGAGDVPGSVHSRPESFAVEADHSQKTVHSSAEPFVDALPLGTAIPFTPDNSPDPEWLRLQVRQLIREFLMVVPRSQASTTVTFPRQDGTPRTISRAELSAAIDRMRPRQKQIIRLAVEERRTQEDVCALLNGISLRTLQRDQAEALDLLAQL